jgi:hypothetical protein
MACVEGDRTVRLDRQLEGTQVILDKGSVVVAGGLPAGSGPLGDVAAGTAGELVEEGDDLRS